MTRLRRMNADEVERILRKYGFELVSQKGSHRKWRSKDQDNQVIVPSHRGRDLPTGTLRNIMITGMIPEKNGNLHKTYPIAIAVLLFVIEKVRSLYCCF